MNNFRYLLSNLCRGLILLFIVQIASASTLSDNTYYRVCFTPGQQCTSLIVNTIDAANKSIYVQAYSFTASKIGDALIEAEKRGVKVFIILDKSQLKERNSQLTNVFNANIPIWIDNKVVIAHNKVMVIDDKIVITGSFNFTNSAQKRNAENLLIIENTELASKYYKNWLARQSQSYKYQ